MSDQENKQQPGIEGGTYEVIRRRLEDQAEQLKSQVDQLNTHRQELFGSSSAELLSTERVHTEYNCLPRDLIMVQDGRMLLGYEVFMGLKQETKVEDVFCKIAFTDDGLRVVEPRLLHNDKFSKDFAELFRYFKDAKLLQLRRTETHILMIFQTGARASDLKVLRWAINGNDISYMDNRGERDHVFPPAHDFTWTRTGREHHCQGEYPHVNINDDEVFVECTGGDLTVKVENNTSSGAGIYAEAVDDRSQGLDDAEIWYAALEGCIVLKILPYREKNYRYLVYNRQSQEAVRIDTVGFSCQQLPEGHGLIFANGYYLANGQYKVFPYEADDYEFVRIFRAPNGEDIAYVFHHRISGLYILLQYNLIRREVTTPLQCHGYSLLEDGRIILMRADEEPSRVHVMQVWQTPFCSEEYAAAQPQEVNSFLAELGNRELVRGISDLLHIHRQIRSQTPNAAVYEDLLQLIDRSLDSYHWLGHDEAGGLLSQLQQIRGVANTIIDEFEKVRQLQQQAASSVQHAAWITTRSAARD